MCGCASAVPVIVDRVIHSVSFFSLFITSSIRVRAARYCLMFTGVYGGFGGEKKGKKKNFFSNMQNGQSGLRSRYLSHAKRAIYQLI